MPGVKLTDMEQIPDAQDDLDECDSTDDKADKLEGDQMNLIKESREATEGNTFWEEQCQDRTLHKAWKAAKGTRPIDFYIQDELPFHRGRCNKEDIEQLVLPQSQKTTTLRMAHASLTDEHLTKIDCWCTSTGQEWTETQHYTAETVKNVRRQPGDTSTPLYPLPAITVTRKSSTRAPLEPLPVITLPRRSPTRAPLQPLPVITLPRRSPTRAPLQPLPVITLPRRSPGDHQLEPHWSHCQSSQYP